MSQRADLVAGFVKQFRRERTCAHTCTICFEDTINLANLIGRDAQTCACTGTDSVGGSDERIRTEINIEHCALRTFAQNRLTL